MPKRVLGNRQVRTSNAIIKFLRQEGEASTSAIYDYLNDRQRSGLPYGCTTGRCNNLLGKMPEFVEAGEVYLPDRYYWVKTWRLAEWV